MLISKIMAEYCMLNQKIGLHLLTEPLAKRLYDDRVEVYPTHYISAFESKEIPHGGRVEPSCFLDERTAQKFMDELWKCGIRPTQEVVSGQLGAMTKHLDDLRTITFHALKIPAK